MRVNGQEMEQMIHETYAPGHEMVMALNMMYDLVKDNGLEEDPRYKDASRIMVECMVKFQDMGFERGMDVCRKNSIINSLRENKIGNYLVNKIIKKLES